MWVYDDTMTTTKGTTMNKQYAEATIAKWVVKLGLGFHPDTRANDYFDANNKPSLTAQQQAQYEQDMEIAFAVLGQDVYRFTLDCMKEVAQ